MKPILFSTEMVQAILDGRKIETRRPIKPQGVVSENGGLNLDNCTKSMVSKANKFLPEVLGLKFYAPYQKGDILYVRETWQCFNPYSDKEYVYKATNDCSDVINMKWLPSIHMPREAARIFLRVTDVRVERLQDITEEGAVAEGISNKELDFIAYSGKPEFEKIMDKPIEIEQFKILWDSVYKSRGYGWDTNPWVWVIKFERIDRSEVPE